MDIPTDKLIKTVLYNGVNISLHHKLQFTNVSVPTSSWIADSSYDGYLYRAAVACVGVTSDMFPYVEFSANDVDDGYYAIYAESYNGGVYIYSEIIPDVTMTIPKIRIFKET